MPVMPLRVRAVLLTATMSAVLVFTAYPFVHGQSMPAADGPRFDVVSIKRNTSERASEGPSVVLRADGGLTMRRVPTISLLGRAFDPITPKEMIGVPGWASTEHYDVRATSSLKDATPAQRQAMVRALLADRFKLLAHVERHQASVYQLVLAGSDGRLGPGLTKSALDCGPILEALAANPPSPTPPDLSRPPDQCTVRTMDAPLRDRYGDRNGHLGALLEGEAMMDALASVLRLAVDRPVVNATGLPDTYHMKMNFKMTFGGRESDPTGVSQALDDGPPSVFTALREQLGLKLKASQIQRDTIVIDHIERPTED